MSDQNKRRILKACGLLFLFVVLQVVIFRKYFFQGKVPFPSNLLVSYYSPFKQEVYKGFEKGIPNKPIGQDNLRMFYPSIKFTIDEFKSGRIPLWNPYLYSGIPHMAQQQSAVWYPMNVIYLLLPLIDGWSVMVIIQAVFAGIFMYIFLRSLELDDVSSLFGAFVWAYSGWMIIWWTETLVISHSIIWLPLALFSVSQFWKKHSYLYLLGIVFSLVMSLLAGFLQIFIYVYILVVLWNVKVIIANKKRHPPLKDILINGSVYVGVIGLCAFQLLPSFEAYMKSARPLVDTRYLFNSFLVPVNHLITLIAPDYWGSTATYNFFNSSMTYYEKMFSMGVIPTVFAIAYFIYKPFKGSLFWKLVALITLLLGLQTPIAWILYTLKIPLLSSFQPSRIFAIFTFAFSVVSAFGFYEWRQNAIFKKYLHIGIIILFSLLLIGTIYAGFPTIFPERFLAISRICTYSENTLLKSLCRVFYDPTFVKWGLPYARVSLRNLFISWIILFVTFAVLRFRKYRNLQAGILFISLALYALYFSNKYLFFSERQFVFPQSEVLKTLKEISGYNRVWSYGNAYVETNLLSYYRIFSPEGYAVFYPNEYGNVLESIRNNGTYLQTTRRSDADLSPAGEDIAITDNNVRMRLMSLLSVRYILESKKGDNKNKLTEDQRFPGVYFVNVWENDNWRIWKYKEALPRTYVACKPVHVKTTQEALNILTSLKTDLNNVVVLDGNTKDQYPCGNSNANIISYLPSKIVIETMGDGGVLVLNDMYYEGWKATIDGKQQEIHRANLLFRGVLIPKGKHNVQFTYEPASFTNGLLISKITLFVMCCIFIPFAYKQSGSRRNRRIREGSTE